MDYERLIRVARGEEPADLLIKNAQIVNVLSGKIESGDVIIADGYFAGVGSYTNAGRVIDLKGKYIAPTYMDAHIHIESTMLTPAEFARAVLPKGTTSTVSDPHEIANVFGIRGIELMLKLSESLPFDFYFTLSSCVPATHMETSGAKITAEDLERLTLNPRIVALAELMNFPGVIFHDREVMAKLKLAHERKMIVDGHSPGLLGNDLNAYLCGGILSDHECTSVEEAREKLKKGMWIFLREGTTEKNLLELLPLVNDFTMSRMCIVSDDKDPVDILEVGHLNASVHLAVRNGISPTTAFRMASLNPASYYRLYFRGAIAPGYKADFQFLHNLEEDLLKPLAVFKDGKMVAENSELIVPISSPTIPEWAIRSVNLNRQLSADDFKVQPSGSKMRVINVILGQIFTKGEVIEVDGMRKAVPDPTEDILKLAVVERYSGQGKLSVGFVKGFGLKSGALASSVAHDSHNLICVGTNDNDMAYAINQLARLNGGLIAVNDGSIIGAVPLPLAGLMSVESATETARKLTLLLRAVKEKLSSSLDNPFMSLSFLALPVIPELKLTDKGLVDVNKFEIVSLFES